MSGFAINQLTISGNLTSDPELRRLDSGHALCKLRIAHNERVKLADGSWIDQPQYFDVTIWGDIAVIAHAADSSAGSRQGASRFIARARQSRRSVGYN